MAITLSPFTLQTRPHSHFAGLKIPLGARAAEEIPALWQTFMAQNPAQFMQDDAEYGLCSAGNEGTEYSAAVMVAAGAQLPPHWCVLSVPAASFAVFPHTEPVWRIRETIEMIFAPGGLTHPHQPLNNLAFFERYTPEFDPQTGLGGMSIWVPVNAAR